VSPDSILRVSDLESKPVSLFSKFDSRFASFWSLFTSLPSDIEVPYESLRCASISDRSDVRKCAKRPIEQNKPIMMKAMNEYLRMSTLYNFSPKLLKLLNI